MKVKVGEKLCLKCEASPPQGYRDGGGLQKMPSNW